jgi:hypothetical protein
VGLVAVLLVSGSQLRIWSHDNFGEDLLYNVRDGGIYLLGQDVGRDNPRRAVVFAVWGEFDADDCQAGHGVGHDRHVIAFGCDAQGNASECKIHSSSGSPAKKA